MDVHTAPIVEERVRIPALDGYELGGTFYYAADQAQATVAAVVNSGGGVPAARYSRIAKYLAGAGVATLTYDYRGIGHSRPARLRGFSAVLEDWSEFDCGGAIAWLKARQPDAELVGVGHSVGTLIFGGARQAGQLTRFVMICPHIGYFGDYRLGYRLPMAILWHGVMPTLTLAFGYFPARALRLGSDIPAGIALQWAARVTPSLRPNSRGSSASRGAMAIERCLRLTSPALLITAGDDAFATVRGARRFLGYFPRFSAIHWVIQPKSIGVRKLGHFGLFRAEARREVWPAILAYILQGIDPPEAKPVKFVEGRPVEVNTLAVSSTVDDEGRA